MATPVITYPHWDQSQSAWISPGERLQIPVPMAKKGRLLRVEFDVSRGPLTSAIPASVCREMDVCCLTRFARRRAAARRSSRVSMSILTS